jgi:hypothetical protein
MKNSACTCVLAVGAAVAAVQPGMSYAGFDASKNLVCAAIDVVGCVGGPDCSSGQAATFDLPQFMVVDFEQKVIRATDESGHKEVSPIRNLEQTDLQLILQGVENHRGWSAAIDRRTGQMTVTSAGPEVSFMIFGACTAL